MLLTTTGKAVVIPAVAGKSIRVKSYAITNYGAANAVVDIIDRVGADEVNLATDATFDAHRIHRDDDDDGVIVTRPGAELVVNMKAAVVVNIRINWWYVP